MIAQRRTMAYSQPSGGWFPPQGGRGRSRGGSGRGFVPARGPAAANDRVRKTTTEDDRTGADKSKCAETQEELAHVDETNAITASENDSAATSETVSEKATLGGNDSQNIDEATNRNSNKQISQDNTQTATASAA